MEPQALNGVYVPGSFGAPKSSCLCNFSYDKLFQENSKIKSIVYWIISEEFYEKGMLFSNYVFCHLAAGRLHIFFYFH